MTRPIRGLTDCHSILDLQALAQRRLPAPIYEYLVGGAESESTAQRNTAAFEDLRLVPRCLIDVSSIDTSTRILGQKVEWPVFCSPSGASRFYHPDGELAVARAAAKAGSLYSLAVAGSHSLEQIAALPAGPKLFQLFIFKDRDLTRGLIERAKHAGYPALCMTVDVAVRGKRERELRSGMGVPPKLSWPSMASIALHPQWFLGQWRKGPLSMANIAPRAPGQGFSTQARYFGEQIDPAASWTDLRQCIEAWGGPFAVKGILCAEDAHRAVDAGATAVIVSNHGGRQLDVQSLPWTYYRRSWRLSVIAWK
jgi:L-lactate dehydrogenase (cytochrome)